MQRLSFVQNLLIRPIERLVFVRCPLIVAQRPYSVAALLLIEAAQREDRSRVVDSRVYEELCRDPWAPASLTDRR